MSFSRFWPALSLRQLAPLVWPPAGAGAYLIALQALVGFAAAWQVWDLARNIRHNFFGKDSDLQRIGQILAIVLMVLAWLLIGWWGVCYRGHWCRGNA